MVDIALSGGFGPSQEAARLLGPAFSIGTRGKSWCQSPPRVVLGLNLVSSILLIIPGPFARKAHVHVNAASRSLGDLT